MARGELTPQEIEIRKIISENINRLLSSSGKTQAAMSEHTKIPKSTITGYVKGTSTPNPGNIQKIADFFGVKKSEIDPRFSNKNLSLNIGRPKLQKIARKASKLSDSDLDMLNGVMEQIFKGKFNGKD